LERFFSAPGEIVDASALGSAMAKDLWLFLSRGLNPHAKALEVRQGSHGEDTIVFEVDVEVSQVRKALGKELPELPGPHEEPLVKLAGSTSIIRRLSKRVDGNHTTSWFLAISYLTLFRRPALCAVKPNDSIDDPLWETLKDNAHAIEILLGGALPRPSRWDMLLRHLHFGVIGNFNDIVRLDWPAVKSGLTTELYDKDEPVPVEVEDLGTLAETQPSGVIATRLKWESLTEEDFERLIFALISTTPGYENPSWLTRTNAADRGRELSVVRVTRDHLSAVSVELASSFND
jgi:hypothetical protein